MEGMQLALARTPSFAINRQELGWLGETVATKTALVRIIAVLLAMLHAALAITAAMEKSPTFDEPTHLTAGYSYWLKNDYRLDPENGNWPARWAALPLLWSRPAFPENAAWNQGDVGRVSEVFLYRRGNDSDRVVLQGRSMMAVLGASLCLLIFFCSNRLFGPLGGLISELLAVFDPNLLAHSALVTSDVTAAFFFTAAAWSYSRLLRYLNARWFVITALSWSGLFLAKMSAAAFLLVAGILVTVQLASCEPITLRVSAFEQRITGFWRKLIVVSGATAALLAVVVLAIWASFTFRSLPFPQNTPAREVWNARWNACLSDHTALENMVGFARDHKLLPEAYLYGFAFTNKSAMYRPAFLDGEWSNTGFSSFFPRAFLYKTPIPVREGGRVQRRAIARPANEPPRRERQWRRRAAGPNTGPPATTARPRLTLRFRVHLTATRPTAKGTRHCASYKTGAAVDGGRHCRVFALEKCVEERKRQNHRSRSRQTLADLDADSGLRGLFFNESLEYRASSFAADLSRSFHRMWSVRIFLSHKINYDGFRRRYALLANCGIIFRAPGLPRLF